MLFSKPLSELDAADIQALISRQQQEDVETEFKEALSGRNGDPDKWMVDQSGIGNAAKEALTKEIIAFANTQGGTLILGIAEDGEKRASTIVELPKCRALAERLGASIMSSTDPKITTLDVVGVPITDEAGVVVFQVPQSVRAPHRDTNSRECYRRRNDSSEPMTMREVQDLTIDRTRSFKRVTERLHEGAGLPCSLPWMHVGPSGMTGPHGSYITGNDTRAIALCAARAVAVPLEPVTLPNLVGNNLLSLPNIPLIEIDHNGQRSNNRFSRHVQWQPILRGIRDADKVKNDVRRFQRVIANDGRIVVEMERPEHIHDAVTQGIPASWLLAVFAELIGMVEVIRTRISRPNLEYALLFEWRVLTSVNILPAGSMMFFEPIRTHTAYNLIADIQMPTRDRLGALYASVETDFWHSTGTENMPLTNFDFDASLATLLKSPRV